MSKIYTSVGLCLILILISCQKELPQHLIIDSYEFVSLDEGGGSWVPVLLTKGGDISIPAPTTSTSAAYQQELSSLKAAMAKISSAEKAAIDYWTQNPVIRWNEIALELIAKYNLIPGPNPDGTYTLPNATNPTGPPAFPFANPPYASRVLAYLSVAQFDGMISAWHYKFIHRRPAPYQIDPAITYAYEKNSLPAYPAHGAVTAAIAKKILTAMFPLEAEFLALKETEHLQSLWLSGGQVQSDISAGKIIGESIANLALQRAATDGMKNAQGNKSIGDSLAQAAQQRFGWHWENQEIPQRPVGLLPLFGQVTMWSVPHVADVRPGPPPAVGSAEMQADIELLKNYAKNLTPPQRRIANFWQDGLSTYTPPGHWNRFALEFILKYQLNPLRSARTLAYLNMAIMDAGISCWDTKYYYHFPRPIQMIDGFKTIAGTPNFPAYTSGHSTFSAAAAEILAYIFPSEASNVRARAEEAAISRVYGGIHWTFDASVGTQQGRIIAKYTITRAKMDGSN